jgi:hypothetical protein
MLFADAVAVPELVATELIAVVVKDNVDPDPEVEIGPEPEIVIAPAAGTTEPVLPLTVVIAPAADMA